MKEKEVGWIKSDGDLIKKSRKEFEEEERFRRKTKNGKR